MPSNGKASLLLLNLTPSANEQNSKAHKAFLDKVGRLVNILGGQVLADQENSFQALFSSVLKHRRTAFWSVWTALQIQTYFLEKNLYQSGSRLQITVNTGDLHHGQYSSHLNLECASEAKLNFDDASFYSTIFANQTTVEEIQEGFHFQPLKPLDISTKYGESIAFFKLLKAPLPAELAKNIFPFEEPPDFDRRPAKTTFLKFLDKLPQTPGKALIWQGYEGQGKTRTLFDLAAQLRIRSIPFIALKVPQAMVHFPYSLLYLIWKYLKTLYACLDLYTIGESINQYFSAKNQECLDGLEDILNGQISFKSRETLFNYLQHIGFFSTCAGWDQTGIFILLIDDLHHLDPHSVTLLQEMLQRSASRMKSFGITATYPAHLDLPFLNHLCNCEPLPSPSLQDLRALFKYHLENHQLPPNELTSELFGHFKNRTSAPNCSELAHLAEWIKNSYWKDWKTAGADFPEIFLDPQASKAFRPFHKKSSKKVDQMSLPMTPKLPKDIENCLQNRIQSLDKNSLMQLIPLAVLNTDFSPALYDELAQENNDPLSTLVDLVKKAFLVELDIPLPINHRNLAHLSPAVLPPSSFPVSFKEYALNGEELRRILYSNPEEDIRQYNHQKIFELLIKQKDLTSSMVSFIAAYHCKRAGLTVRSALYYQKIAQDCCTLQAKQEACKFYRNAWQQYQILREDPQQTKELRNLLLKTSNQNLIDSLDTESERKFSLLKMDHRLKDSEINFGVSILSKQVELENQLGDFEAATVAGKELLALLEKSSAALSKKVVSSSLISVHLHLSKIHLQQDQLDPAEDHAKEALEWARKTNDLKQQCFSLELLGYIQTEKYQYENAYTNFRQGLTTSQKLDSNEINRRLMLGMARVNLYLYNLDKSKELYQQALSLPTEEHVSEQIKELKLNPAAVEIYCGLALCSIYKEDLAEAFSHLEKAQVTVDNLLKFKVSSENISLLPFQTLQAKVKALQGRLWMALGDQEKVFLDLEEALKISKKMKSRFLLADIHLNLAEAYLTFGPTSTKPRESQPNPEQSHLNAIHSLFADPIFGEKKEPDEMLIIRQDYLQALLYHQQNKNREALDLLKKALDKPIRNRDSALHAKLQTLTGKIYRQLGDLVSSRSYLTAASRSLQGLPLPRLKIEIWSELGKTSLIQNRFAEAYRDLKTAAEEIELVLSRLSSDWQILYMQQKLHHQFLHDFVGVLGKLEKEAELEDYPYLFKYFQNTRN